ncbi:hypothetical protein J19TS2_05490 [Cohnella xylanilytica]|nr:hypothetical protein J19TS2_05490 [Cohnella xylanilytica]
MIVFPPAASAVPGTGANRAQASRRKQAIGSANRLNALTFMMSLPLSNLDAAKSAYVNIPKRNQRLKIEFIPFLLIGLLVSDDGSRDPGNYRRGSSERKMTSIAMREGARRGRTEA